MISLHSDTYAAIAPSLYHGSLQGQVAAVTGAGRGIGKSIALALGAAGASVACIAKTAIETAAVAAEIQNHFGVSTMSIAADVSEPATVRRITKEIEAKLGPIDILVNNAAISKVNSVEHERDFASWWRVLEINLRGPAAFVYEVLPGMLSRNRGTIVSLASRCGSENIPFTSAYSASKAALMRFHHVLALEIGARPVYTYLVQPGDVPTSLSKTPGVIDLETLQKVPALREMLRSTAGRCTETSELTADTVVVLVANERAKILTGLCINAQQDIEQVLEDAEKHASSKIKQDKLYILKMDEL